MNKRIISFAMLGILSVASFGMAINTKPVETKVAAITGYTNHDGDTYYNGISDSLEGEELLSALRSLNGSKRKSTVGYNPMGTSPSGYFRYTDYDPSTILYDDNNQPYGTKIISFYSGNQTSSFNREHVWPKSHGGNLVENDIHMPRPTIQSENGSRGNSFYVEGKKDGTYGWDPAMESFGEESYRGDSARIIFYCVVASSSLSLVDLEYHSTSNNNRDNLMGKLSDMLKWNLNYPVLDREQNRNEGAEYLQGNRNPFIDHPEYACKIWGNYNDNTKNVCGAYLGKQVKIMLDGQKASDTTIDNGSSKTFEAYVDDAAVTNVTWSLVNSTDDPYNNDKIRLSVSEGKATVTAVQSDVAYLKVSYSYTDSGTTRTATSKIKITATAPVTLTTISVENAKTEYVIGEDFVAPDVIAHYSDQTTQNVKEHASFSGFDSVSAGTKTITVTYLDKSTTYQVTVSEPAPILNNISVGNPKTNYKIGDEFVRPAVTANYSDGSSRDVSSQATFTGFDSSTEGIKTIVVTYQDKSTTYEVVVYSGSYEPTKPSTPSNGCGGNIATASIILSSLAALGIVAIVTSKIIHRKKKLD